MSTRYADYDPFARAYNRHWGGQCERHLDMLDAHVLNRLTNEAHILDLCCGTGQLARVLADKGHQVLGIDGSERMLSFARVNAPSADFVLADARRFHVNEPVDAVLCMFDSLNHLMSEADLSLAFGRVARALLPGGVFAFDLNMEIKYVTTWAGEFSLLADHEVVVVRTSADLEARRALFDATVFCDDGEGRWSRDEVRLVQTWYEKEQIIRLLRRAGFDEPETYIKQALPGEPEAAQNLLFVTSRVN